MKKASKPQLPNHAKVEETAVLLQKELRRRGMTQSEIDTALKKKKRRSAIEFNAVKSKHLLDPRSEATSNANAKSGYSPYRNLKPRTSEELCTVDFAAKQLKLHPKTVLRFIREGRLTAKRVGKSYRILHSDLEAFAGMPAQAIAPVEAPSVTSIVDIPGIGPELAQKWASTVTAALHSRPQEAPAFRAEVIYEPARLHIKIVLVGSTDDVVGMLSLIRVWTTQLRA